MKEDRRTRKSKKALKEALLELMKRKNLSNISIKELCETADLNRSTFYSNYPDFNSLVSDIYMDFLRDMFASLDEALEETDFQEEQVERHIAIFLLKYMERNIDMYRLLLKPEEGGLYARHLMDYCVRTYQLDDKPLMIRYGGLYHLLGGFLVICQWIREDHPCSIEELADLLYAQTNQYWIERTRKKYKKSIDK